MSRRDRLCRPTGKTCAPTEAPDEARRVAQSRRADEDRDGASGRDHCVDS
jgi:hypothetical protein